MCRFLSGIAAMGYAPSKEWLRSVLDTLEQQPRRLTNAAIAEPEVSPMESWYGGDGSDKINLSVCPYVTLKEDSSL